ncbi:hypothetical protein FQN60_012715, partial [Etheostoma spectabile]
LINEHKSVHGDSPFARDEQRHPEAPTSARGRGHSRSVTHPHGSRGGLYAPQSRGSWRKTYSLSNKNSQSSVGRASASTSSSVHQTSSHSVAYSTSLPSNSRGESDRITPATLSSGIPQQKKEGQTNSITGRAAAKKENTDSVRKTRVAVSQCEDGTGDSGSTDITTGQHKPLHGWTQDLQERTESRRDVLPENKVSGSLVVLSSARADTSTSLQSSPPVLMTPPLSSKTSAETKPTSTTPAVFMAGNTIPPLSVSELSKQPSIKPTSHTSQGQVSSSFLKKSKFTWVKSRNVGGVDPQQASSISSPKGKAVAVAPASVSKAGVASGSSPLCVNKRTPGKKLPRKLSSINVAPKTSKYKWVSSSAGAQAKVPRKSPSPKALALSQRALEKSEVTKKLRAPSAKMRKGIAGSSANSSTSSRYRWKAGGPSTSAAVAGGTTATRRRSAFHWTSEKSNKGVKGVASPSVTQRTPFMPSSSPSGFKLRSRMKIIRKSATSGGGSEKGTSPSAVRYSPRGRMHSSTRSPVGVRRTPSRELVSFGRHKLRRLSPTSSRTTEGSSSHPCSPCRGFVLLAVTGEAYRHTLKRRRGEHQLTNVLPPPPPDTMKPITTTKESSLLTPPPPLQGSRYRAYSDPIYFTHKSHVLLCIGVLLALTFATFSSDMHLGDTV